jgi:hypothetical protein
MNVIIFIIRVLKLLFMHGNYFFLAFAVILVFASPAAGSLTKITAGAPVYIGEQNLDISAGLQGCRVIEWWPTGTERIEPAQKNVTVIKTLDDSNIAFSYTVRPEIFNGYEGTWYCEGQRPLRPVFQINKPRLTVRFWDLDNEQDVSGQTIPLTANITYRIDTNLDKALQLKYRPEMTPLDSFYTVTLSDPSKKSLLSVYTGSYGKTGSQALLFDKKPMITLSPFFWKDGSAWDRTSRNIQGDYIYPPGTYTVTVNQDLNRMREMYATTDPEDKVDVLDSSASVTFVKTVLTPESTVSAPVTVSPGTPATSEPVPTSLMVTDTTVLPTETTIPPKTTYSPVPVWLVLSAIGVALACAGRLRK